MKSINLFLTLVCILIFGNFYSQSLSSQSNTVSVIKFNNENSKFIGKYHLRKIAKSDTTIIYDYIEIFEKNGQLLCKRDMEHNFYEADAKVLNKKFNRHDDCQLVKIDEQNKTIIIKYINKEYVYKFLKNSSNNYEIIIVDKALVYEKK